jgi:hypothetical protein
MIAVETKRAIWTTATLVVFFLLALRISSHAQQTTGQLLISSGFNPIAAITPDMTRQLMSLPANQFVLRRKGSRSYYVYADPSECTCAYVGSAAAMDKYRASFRTLPAEALSSGGFANPERNLIDSMNNDDAGAQFNNDVFGSDF